MVATDVASRGIGMIEKLPSFIPRIPSRPSPPPYHLTFPAHRHLPRMRDLNVVLTVACFACIMLLTTSPGLAAYRFFDLPWTLAE